MHACRCCNHEGASRAEAPDVPYIRPEGAPERASRLGHVRTALDPSVHAALAAFHLPPAALEPPPIADLLVEAATLPASGLPTPVYAVSVDGSMQEVEVRPEFPSARVGFAQVAGVFSNLTAFTPAPRGGFVDPAAIARATNAALVKGVVPTSVVTIRPGQTQHEAWREAVHDLFTNCRLDGPTGVTTTLVDVLAHVLGAPGGPIDHVVLDKCPGRHDRDCSNGGLFVPLGGASCPACGTAVYFTDATNTHDEERAGGRPGLPVIVGVEKTGTLAEHAEHISAHIPPGYLLTLPDAYIRDHVQHRGGSRAYGYDTDYGRRFIYRARDGRTIVFSVPPLPDGDPTDDAVVVDLRRYPTLDTTVALLDRVGTMLYRNAVIPIALAHSFASLPLGTGSQVLTYLAQDALGTPRTPARPSLVV